MSIKEMIKYLESRGYKITEPEIVTYKVEISFNGYIGSTDVIEIDAPKNCSEEYLKEIMLTDYMYELLDELEVVEVKSLTYDEDTWEVTFDFAGYIGTDATYTVDASDEDEAIEAAQTDAMDDFDIVSFEVEE